MRVQWRVGPFVFSGDPSAGAKPASRRSNKAALITLITILLIVGMCAGIGAMQ